MIEGLEEGTRSLDSFLSDVGFGEDEGPSVAPADASAAESGTPPATPAEPTPAAAGTAGPEVPVETEPKPETPAPAEAPAVAVPAAVPAPAGSPATAEDDPLKDALPFTYTVNGEVKPYDGIKVFEGGGGVIEPQALQDLQRKLGERDHLYTQNQHLYQRTQQYEKAGGVQKLRDLELLNAQLDAGGQKLLDTVKTMLGAEEHKDLLASVLRELTLDIREAKYAAQTRLQTASETETQKTTQAQNDERTFTATLQDIRKYLPALTDEDMTHADAHFRLFKDSLFRPATLEESTQYGVRVGERVIDPTKMHGWFLDRAALRTAEAKRNADWKKLETERPTMEKENTARLAAAAKGTKGTKAASPTARPVAKKEDEPPKRSQRATDADKWWELQESLQH